MDANTEKIDSIFTYLIESSGSLPNFFDNMFSFFLRNSDFYKQQDVNKTFLDEKFDFYAQKHRELEKQLKINEDNQRKERELLEKNKEGNLIVKNISKDEMENLRIAQDTLQAAKRDPDTISINSTMTQNSLYSKRVFEDDKSVEANMVPNEGNGGRCKKYCWTQTLAEVTISMLVGEKIRSKDVDIKYSTKKLFVGLRDGPTIINGDLAYPIKPDTVIWTFDKSDIKGTKYLTITFEKVDGINWWDCVIKGDPTIDLTRINASNPDISHFGTETKAKLEQVMYDQSQIISGKPTSNEQMKKDKYKAFMEANPQFNFDKVKIKEENDNLLF